MVKQKIIQDQILAMKQRDQNKVTTLRYILAQLKNKEIDKKGELSNEEELVILRKIGKELKESIDAFRKGKREDLIAQYESQLKLLGTYLPQEISDEELKKEVEKIIAENKEVYDKNPKAVIGIAMKQLKNKADPSRILKLLQRVTSNK